MIFFIFTRVSLCAARAELTHFLSQPIKKACILHQKYKILSMAAKKKVNAPHHVSEPCSGAGEVECLSLLHRSNVLCVWE